MRRENPVVWHSSTDSTLALGAQSFIENYQSKTEHYLADPSSEHCFITFVDLIVNSETCFLMLPDKQEWGHEPIFIKALEGLLKRVPQCASVPLTKKTENAVFSGFFNLLSNTVSRYWLADWLRWQLLSDLVSVQHGARLGAAAEQFSVITDEGWETWASRLTPQRRDAIREPLISLQPGVYANDIRVAGDMALFQYGYAFDVFRRGWQYAERSRKANLDIEYCPHTLREAALESGSRDWVTQAQSEYWSWGRCLAYLIKTATTPISTEQVADWIHQIVAAHPQRWMKIPSPEEDTPKTKREIRTLIDHLEATADKARLPKKKLRKLGLPIELGEVGIEIAREDIKLGAIQKTLAVLHVDKVLARVVARIEDVIQDGVNVYARGTFGHAGLISPPLLGSAAPPRA